MKRLIIVVLLIAIAAVAGMVRSHTKGVSLNELPEALSGDQTAGDTREEIRRNYELSPGALVLVAGINGPVEIETADVTTAEVFVERLGQSREALARRKITIENTPTGLEIRGRKGEVGFFARIFGSNPSERVSLKLPRQISLTTKGVNGAVTIGEIDGPVEVHGVNGKVRVGQATGAADFHGINGNITVALKDLKEDAVSLKGVNGDIELRLAPGLNADLEARGMNGNVVSDLPEFVLEKSRHGNYLAHVGSGGNSITARGINGNIRLTR